MPVDHISASGTSENVANQILLVEDEAETAAFIKELLEQRGYRVDVARDAGQAQSQFAVRKPDFIILDLILPGQSGFELCDRFKQIEKTVPILILSVIDMEDSRKLARKAGADGRLAFGGHVEIAGDVGLQVHACGCQPLGLEVAVDKVLVRQVDGR